MPTFVYLVYTVLQPTPSYESMTSCSVDDLVPQVLLSSAVCLPVLSHRFFCPPPCVYLFCPTGSSVLRRVSTCSVPQVLLSSAVCLPVLSHRFFCPLPCVYLFCPTGSSVLRRVSTCSVPQVLLSSAVCLPVLSHRFFCPPPCVYLFCPTGSSVLRRVSTCSAPGGRGSGKQSSVTPARSRTPNSAPSWGSGTSTRRWFPSTWRTRWEERWESPLS